MGTPLPVVTPVEESVRLETSKNGERQKKIHYVVCNDDKLRRFYLLYLQSKLSLDLSKHKIN